MYFSLLQGHGTSLAPFASGAPRECMHGTTRLSPLSISARTGRPILAMIRMFATAYGESVSWTPIRDIRSEEHTSELQSPMYLVCRLLHEKSYDLFHLGKGKGFDLVLKSRERLQIRFWQQVFLTRRHLSRFHVCPSQRFYLS